MPMKAKHTIRMKPSTVELARSIKKESETLHAFIEEMAMLGLKQTAKKRKK